MTVSELIEKLRSYEPSLEVLCFAENSDGGTITFEIAAISVSDVEKVRDVRGQPAIKFGASATARQAVVMEITSDV